MAFSSCLLQAIKPPVLGKLTTLFNPFRLTSKTLQGTQFLDKSPVTNLKSNISALDSQTIFQNVNNNLSSPDNHGRLFAVVQLCGKQFKVTSGDIIIVEGYWQPTISDRIRLEKVLLVGAKNFTLLGRPILEPGLVDVQATIIEKTLSHTKTHFKKKRRKQYTRINFQRSPHTMIRINSVDVIGKINESVQNINPVRIF